MDYSNIKEPLSILLVFFGIALLWASWKDNKLKKANKKSNLTDKFRQQVIAAETAKSAVLAELHVVDKGLRPDNGIKATKEKAFG